MPVPVPVPIPFNPGPYPLKPPASSWSKIRPSSGGSRHVGYAQGTSAGRGKRPLAVEAVMRERFDSILMDCQMPEMDGFTATATIRQQEREAADHRHIIIAPHGQCDGG